MLHLQRLDQQQAHAEAIAFTLAQENERLRERLLRLEHDDALLEKLARERLGWIKSGEFVYRVEGLESGRWGLGARGWGLVGGQEKTSPQPLDPRP